MSIFYKNFSLKKIQLSGNSVAFNLLFASLFLFIFVIRTLHCAPSGDEINNTIMAWRPVTGDRPWIEIWELFQAGNCFLTPLLFIYYKVTENTDGILLFSRSCFLIYCSCIALYCIFIFKEQVCINGKIWLFVAIVTFAPFCLYYFWYDTVGLTLMLLGGLFLYKSFMCFYNGSHKLFFIAGIIHALMAYAYQGYVIVAIVYFFLVFFLSSHFKIKFRDACLYYILGACSVIFCFVMYLLCVGFDNLIFFDKYIMDSIINSHARIDDTQWFLKLARTIYLPVKVYWPLIPIAFSLVIFYSLSVFFWKKNYILLFLNVSFICAIIFLYPKGVISTYYFSFYVACIGIVLTLYKWKNLEDKIKILFYLLCVPSFFSYIMTGLTSNDASKSVLGMYPAYIYSVCFFAHYIYEFNLSKKTNFANLLLVVVCAAQLFFYCSNTFMAGSILSNNIYVSKGVRAGLFVNQNDKKYSDLEVWVKTQLKKEDLSIMVTNFEMNSIYLIKNINVATYFFAWNPYLISNEGSVSWDETKYYWKKVSGIPSIIIDDDFVHKNEELKELINLNYLKQGEYNEFSLYRLNTH